MTEPTPVRRAISCSATCRRVRIVRPLLLFVYVVLLWAWHPREAGAQAGVVPPAVAPTTAPSRSRWLVEMHGGPAIDRDPTSGSGSLPNTASLVQGLVSASTFSFGTGTTLFNQSAVADGITALDEVLTSAGTRRQSGANIGMSLERTLTRRLSLELSTDYVRSRLSLRDETLSGFERTRSTMSAALQQVLATGSAPSDVTVTVTRNDDQTASRLVFTGGLVLNLREAGRTVPYVVGGGGVMLKRGSTPAITLQSRYDVGSPAELLGSDTTTLFFSEDDRAMLFMGGAGVKHALSPRSGLRIDVRMRATRSTLSSFVDLTPSSALVSTGAPHPALQQGALRFDALGPLNGPSISAAKTFAGNGVRLQTSFVLGWFFRM
jgi:hypothetical protein